MKHYVPLVSLIVALFALSSASYAQTPTSASVPTTQTTPAATRTPSPAACNWSLTQVYSRLANAQVAWEIGNSAGALKAAAEARDALEHLVAQCSANATAQPAKIGGIALYFGDDYAEGFNKLEALAWTSGIDLSVAKDSDDFLALLQEPETAAAITFAGQNDRTQASLEKFMQAGGRVVLFYWGWDGQVSGDNKLQQDLFGFKIVGEVLTSAKGNQQLDSDALPPWLAGMRIGCQYQNLEMNGYLVLADSSGLQRSLQSETSARSRLVFYESSSGRLTLFPSIIGLLYEQERYFRGYSRVFWFDDANIDYFDNEKAALAMLKYLVGSTAAPGILSTPDHQRPAQLTDAHVERFNAIQQQVATGRINKTQANDDLLILAGQVGKDAFAWLVRHVPVYNTETKKWQSIDQYAKEFAKDGGVEPTSRLARDPVGTGIDLMFGNPSTDEVLGWLGLSK